MKYILLGDVRAATPQYVVWSDVPRSHLDAVSTTFLCVIRSSSSSPLVPIAACSSEGLRAAPFVQQPQSASGVCPTICPRPLPVGSFESGSLILSGSSTRLLTANLESVVYTLYFKAQAPPSSNQRQNVWQVKFA